LTFAHHSTLLILNIMIVCVELLRDTDRRSDELCPTDCWTKP